MILFSCLDFERIYPVSHKTGFFIAYNPNASLTTWVGHHARLPSLLGFGNLPSLILFQSVEALHPVTASTFPVVYLPGMVNGIIGALALACPQRLLLVVTFENLSALVAGFLMVNGI